LIRLADGLFGVAANPPLPQTMLLRLQNAFASMTRLGNEQERTANNLANANTVGYRRDRTFVSALNERLDIEGAPRTDRMTVQFADDRLGAIEATGNPLDVALQSEGFFVVREATAPSASRAPAASSADADGILRDPQGREVVGQGRSARTPAPRRADHDLGRRRHDSRGRRARRAAARRHLRRPAGASARRRRDVHRRGRPRTGRGHPASFRAISNHRTSTSSPR
jgi:flagellar hook-basal body protein